MPSSRTPDGGEQPTASPIRDDTAPSVRVPRGQQRPAKQATPAEAELAQTIRAAVRGELEGILPYVLAAIKRDRAFDELSDRLSKAERRLETRRERPLAVAVHRLLNRLRHLDFDHTVKASLENELIKILTAAGFDETGEVGEKYDPACHQALSGRAVDGVGTVTEVDARGLSSCGDVIVRAQVRISPPPILWSQRAADQSKPATRQRSEGK